MSTETLTEPATILVVEDDPDMSQLIGGILSDAGFSTHVCHNGEKGFEEAYNRIPDLILLDIMLPGIDGIEVCRKLSSDDRTKHIPIIMVTVKRELSCKLASYISGAKRFISKPFGVDELLNEVYNALQQHSNSRISQDRTDDVSS